MRSRESKRVEDDGFGLGDKRKEMMRDLKGKKRGESRRRYVVVRGEVVIFFQWVQVHLRRFPKSRVTDKSAFTSIPTASILLHIPE